MHESIMPEGNRRWTPNCKRDTDHTKHTPGDSLRETTGVFISLLYLIILINNKRKREGHLFKTGFAFCFAFSFFGNVIGSDNPYYVNLMIRSLRFCLFLWLSAYLLSLLWPCTIIAGNNHSLCITRRLDVCSWHWLANEWSMQFPFSSLVHLSLSTSLVST